MKTNNYILFSILCLNAMFCPQLHAQSPMNVNSNTNIYSLNFMFGDDQNETIYYVSALKRREVLPEMLPAIDDTNGNWGIPTEEMQLSARLHQRELVQGKPVVAVVILRNLSSVPHTLPISDYSFKYTLWQGTNIFTYQKKMPPRNNMREDSSEGWHTIDVKSEGLIFVHLDSCFDLSRSGQYSFQAQMRIPTSDGKTQTNVISGIAAINIVEKR